MELRHIFLIIALFATSVFVAPTVLSLFTGQHSFYDNSTYAGTPYCLKCHSDILQELNSSAHHHSFTCGNCHGIPDTGSNMTHGNVTIPDCLDCHGSSPATVTDQNNNAWIAPAAAVYNESAPAGADAHIPFVLSANNSIYKGNNAACISCHSSFGNGINFSRPGSINWNVTNSSGTWMIENLTAGQIKTVAITKSLDGRMHNITSSVNCVSCHDDIRQAVLSGGHSNEQWAKAHNYTYYTDMNDYCSSCHNPQTQVNNNSPYPAYPFNSPKHGAINISCMDCHGKSNILVNIYGGWNTAPYNSGSMGSIETSIAQQPAFTQSYLCMACKDTGNPVPNPSLHFTYYTEPNVTVILTYPNGTIQTYP
ncbi:MAG: hypothetical protein O8C62_10510 [Candidatus Methanoperedens sp.]|nr:hypothetical protein [Candidatus Methanoperedens sp.]